MSNFSPEETTANHEMNDVFICDAIRTPVGRFGGILEAMEAKYAHEQISTVDGVKIDFATEWVHLRKSNTEPIIRIYTEAPTQEAADTLGDKIISEIKAVAGI